MTKIFRSNAVQSKFLISLHETILQKLIEIEKSFFCQFIFSTAKESNKLANNCALFINY